LDFPDLLRLIDEGSAAFGAAVAAAPGLDVPVPTCPEWTLFDLVRHVGEGRRSWAATIAAGPAATAKAVPEDAPAAPREREALLAWSATATQELLDALREARGMGPGAVSRLLRKAVNGTLRDLASLDVPFTDLG
jgi:uncharacterized protein (TIGR03083 family)